MHFFGNFVFAIIILNNLCKVYIPSKLRSYLCQINKWSPVDFQKSPREFSLKLLMYLAHKIVPESKCNWTVIPNSILELRWGNKSRKSKISKCRLCRASYTQQAKTFQPGINTWLEPQETWWGLVIKAIKRLRGQTLVANVVALELTLNSLRRSQLLRNLSIGSLLCLNKSSLIIVSIHLRVMLLSSRCIWILRSDEKYFSHSLRLICHLS